MLIVEHAPDLKAHEGKELGASEWVEITQEDIDGFARLTGDDHWIHVDVERARAEMPGGRTIAHGLFVLSLVPALQRQIYRIERRGRGFNYGYDRIRFVSPVPVGGRVRLRQALVAATRHDKGTRLELDVTIEVEDAAKPAIVARNIILIEDE
jgi:acyl dehydratase